MALPAETPRVLHVGNGTRGPFSLQVSGTPISFSSSDELSVIRYDNTGAPTELAEGTDYTLSNVSALPDLGDQSRPVTAVTLTLKVTQAVLAADEHLEIERVTPPTQDMAYVLGGGFNSRANERNLDQMVRTVQQLWHTVQNRSMRISPLDPDGRIELADAETRANTVLGFDENGDPQYLDDTFTGPTGPAGADGSVWSSGSGVPTGGADGDFYLRTSNGDVYENINGVWTVVDNLTGPQGSGVGDMLKSENLSGLTNYVTARGNLGLGSIATAAASSYFAVANNLSEGTAATMRSNLGLGAVALLASVAAANTTFAATQRILARKTAGAGAGEESTMSEILDFLGTTRGAIAYRGAAGWALLSPGTATYVLTSNGAGADPTYQAVSSPTEATQSDEETATSTTTYSSPAKFKYNPGAVKAWVRYTDNTTATISSSLNVSSLTDNGVGDATINFTTSFSSATAYTGVGFARRAASTDRVFMMHRSATAPTASAFRILSDTSGGAIALDDGFAMMSGDF
jgi:hypothetical protein